MLSINVYRIYHTWYTVLDILYKICRIHTCLILLFNVAWDMCNHGHSLLIKKLQGNIFYLRHKKMKVLLLFINFLYAASMGSRLAIDFLESLTLKSKSCQSRRVSRRSVRRKSSSVQHKDEDSLAFVQKLQKRNHVFYFK